MRVETLVPGAPGSRWCREEEARKIHNGEAEVRGIYGEASDAKAEALAEDGIEVARLPWVPRADG